MQLIADTAFFVKNQGRHFSFFRGGGGQILASLLNLVKKLHVRGFAASVYIVTSL